MSGMTFYQFVQSHPHLEWFGCFEGNTPKDDCVRIRCTNKGYTFDLPLSTIKETDQRTLEDVLLGRRPAKIMRHITRIVGYYSELSNWNPSKVAELHDRHNGQYGVPELAVAAD